MGIRRAAATGAAVVVLVTAAAGLAGCGTASEPSPPTGVDELTVPTPDPDPRDFVAGVDNPWFPLEPGTATFRVAGTDEPVQQVVADGPEVDGVATTAVTTATPGAADVTDYYAQDADGNVWWFGRAGEWSAGTDGAEAGLLMAATPRVGDGYRLASAPGLDARAQVLTVDEALTTVAGAYDRTVGLEVTLDGATSTRVYARGVGLVQESVEGVVVLARTSSEG